MGKVERHVDIDRMARQAMADKAPQIDLLKEGFPFTPSGWGIVVEPIKPKEVTDGGIVIAGESLQAEAIQITIGRVLKVGPTAMQGKTSSGIELSRFTDDIQTPQDLIGKFVFFQRFVGQRLVLRRSGQSVIVLSITELLGVTSDPGAWTFYLP